VVVARILSITDIIEVVGTKIDRKRMTEAENGALG
jgi:hypothetical protein